jgi:hypothetical protein
LYSNLVAPDKKKKRSVDSNTGIVTKNANRTHIVTSKLNKVSGKLIKKDFSIFFGINKKVL